MDLDDLEVPTQVPSRTSRFAPKSSKFKPKPKTEPVPKPEPEPESQQPSLPPVSKTEPHEFNLANKKNEDSMEIDAPTHTKPEPSATVKIDSETVDASKQGDHMDEDTGDGDDEVVREIDVLFTPSIDENTQLNLLQFPLRSNWRPYELDDECEEIRWKLGSSEAELDLSIELESSNIDNDCARKLNFTKQTLSTSWKPHQANGCAIGLLMGDKLHLHPIHAVVQLRPSLRHLDSGGSKKINSISTGANATTKNEGSVEEKSAATASKKQNKQMKPSIEQKSDGDECWIPLKYHGLKSDMSSRYFQQMVAQESSSIDFTMSAYDYIAALCPGVSNNISKGPSKRYLLSLSVEERLKKMLTEEGPLLRFSALKHIAPEYSDEELLEFLLVHAVLVWGFWVPKSSLLNLDGPKSLARDYVLVLFNKNVQVSDVNVRGPLEGHVKNFLRIFGVEKLAKSKAYAPAKPYWKFRELPDQSFIKRYPDVVKKQEEIFKNKEILVCDNIGNAGKRKHGKSAAVTNSVNGKLVISENSESRVANMGGVPHGKMTVSSEIRQVLHIALKKIFQAHNFCSFQMILQGLRETTLNKAINKATTHKGYSKVAVDAVIEGPVDELKAVISEVACDIHGYYVLKSSPDEPFRDVVIDMLRGSGANAKLKRSEILEAARRKLNRDVPNNEYNKVMSELCVSKGSVWAFKGGDGGIK